MTTRILLGNFEGFSQILKEQSAKKRYLDVFTQLIACLKLWKTPYLKKTSGARVVADYAENRFSNFAIEYLRENEKFRETLFACSYGAQEKKIDKNVVTLSL